MTLQELMVPLSNVFELLSRWVVALAGFATLILLFQAWKSRVDGGKRVVSVRTGKTHDVWCMNAPPDGARISEKEARRLGYREARCCSRKRGNDLDSRN